jgi:hypothetical protein
MTQVLRCVLSAGLLWLAAGRATAQITITASDVASQIVVGASITNVSDTLTKSVNIGSPGASSWDFSGLLYHAGTTLKSVAVASTPYASSFPGATHSMQTQITYEGIDATGYIYLILGTNFLNPGTMGGPPAIPGFKVEVKIVNEPADVTYALPSTYGSTWSSVYTTTQTVLLNGSPSGTPTVTPHNDSYLVDGYGPMKIPGGSIHDVLRIRKKGVNPGGTTISYLFLAKNGASVQVTAADSTLPDNGTIAVNAVSWSAPVNTAVGEEPGLPDRFALEQNYPNPFNPTTVVGVDLPVAGEVRLAIYDILGREVALLAEGRFNAGRHSFTFDGAGLASGVYWCRMTAGGFTAARRMVLVR